jgi:hypothetical protein
MQLWKNWLCHGFNKTNGRLFATTPVVLFVVLLYKKQVYSWLGRIMIKFTNILKTNQLQQASFLTDPINRKTSAFDHEEKLFFYSLPNCKLVKKTQQD